MLQESLYHKKDIIALRQMMYWAMKTSFEESHLKTIREFTLFLLENNRFQGDFTITCKIINGISVMYVFIFKKHLQVQTTVIPWSYNEIIQYWTLVGNSTRTIP